MAPRSRKPARDPDARVTVSDGGRRALRLAEGLAGEAVLCDAGPESACSAAGQEHMCCWRGPSPGKEFSGSAVGRLGETLPQ